jgi:PIN domain
MIVLDANILIRAVLGKRVRFLIEPYSSRRVRFLAPVTAFQEARKYLPTILRKRGISDPDVLPTLQYLQLMIESVDREVYERFEGEARTSSWTG